MSEKPSSEVNLNEGRGLVSYTYRRDAEAQFGAETLASVETAIWEMIKDLPDLNFCIVNPMSLEKPTRHTSKSEYLNYINALKKVSDASRELNEALGELLDYSDNENLQWLGFSEALDDIYFKDPEYAGSKSDFVHRMVEFYGYAQFLFEATERTEKTAHHHAAEQKPEGEEYWNLPHRAPDYYARSIAEQLANIYITTHFKCPSFGTNNNVPSTKYAVALEKVFNSIGITTGIRGPAEWAISKIPDSWIAEIATAKEDRKRRGDTIHSVQRFLDLNRPPSRVELGELEALKKTVADLKKHLKD